MTESNKQAVTGMSAIKIINTEAEMEFIISQFPEAKAVVWYYNEIKFYNIKNSIWNEERRSLENVVRLRMFDASKELHIWRSNNELKGRLRDDTAGSPVKYVDARLILNGTRFTKTADGILAEEDKGIQFSLPYAELWKLEGTNKRAILSTRNYIGYSDLNQAIQGL